MRMPTCLPPTFVGGFLFLVILSPHAEAQGLGSDGVEFFEKNREFNLSLEEQEA